MNVMTRPGWTLEQFLEWEERQPTRYEFDGKNVIDMNGSTLRHQAICGNLHFSLHQHFRTHPGQVWLPSQIHTGHTVRYPDIAVSLVPQGQSQRHIVDPVMLFEVTSECTEVTDLTKKVDEYTGLPSLRRYVVLALTERLILLLVRYGERWEQTKLHDGSLHLPEIGLVLPLVDIYAGVRFQD